MAEQKADIVESEWSHVVKADEVGSASLNLTLSPDEAQRTRLIRRLGLLALDDCEAQVKLKRQSGHMIHVTGEVRARIRHACVVTMEPVKGQVKESFDAWYADTAQAISLSKVKRDKELLATKGEIEMPSEKDDPEAIIDGKIDVGELITQYLSLGIDPYPRAPGVEPADGEEGRSVYEDESVIKNPFAALKDWKDKLK